MQPKFRSDLTCSREEQTGGVFYRIFDEKTQTSFRLYEIEYIIATKLDGERETPAVIQAVKEDFNFDITEPDLQRFVGQLESMGFLEETAAAPTPQSTVPELPPEMGSLDFSEVNPVESPDVQMAAEPVAAAPEIDLLATEETSDAALVVNQAEYERLLKVALMSIWQGYLSTARDYFLAARELDSSDSRISEIIEHLVVIGDAGGADEASYLWKQVSELYPRQVAELEASAKGEMQGEEERAIDHDTGDGWGDEPHAETDLRSRVVWTLALLFLMVGGGAGIYFFVTETGLLESEPLVRVQTLKSITVPMPYPQAATEITPEKEEWLHFGADGKIKELLVVKGQKVKSGDKIASLVLPPKSRKALAQAQRALKKAEKSYAPVAAKLAVLLKKREALESQSVDVEEKLRELQPEGVLRQGGNSKRQLAKLKKKKVGLDK
ncbi:efflux RND transporter periplasmic adaptor subunit, partial [Myxococcota bacterium]|nr:efflux RND transporter periplasmic adaptor subunit [Myxococcota bacterium]